MSNNIHYKVWDGIIYVFADFNVAVVQVWECMSNLIPHPLGTLETLMTSAAAEVINHNRHKHRSIQTATILLGKYAYSRLDIL